MPKLKKNARRLFSKGEIGTYWSSFYDDVQTPLEYHFVERLERSAEVIDQHTTSGGRVLDLGWSGGVLAERLLEVGYTVDAADLSPDMLAFAAERLSRFEQARHRLFEADCENLELPSASYDGVACIGVFGYLDRPDQALREIRRVLKPGGAFVMSVRNVDHRRLFDPWELGKAVASRLTHGEPKQLTATNPRNGEPQPESHADLPNFIDIWDRPRDVIRMVEGHGFTLLEFHGLGYGPPQLARRAWLPSRLGISLSRALSWSFRRARVERFTKWTADISIYVFARRD